MWYQAETTFFVRHGEFSVLVAMDPAGTVAELCGTLSSLLGVRREVLDACRFTYQGIVLASPTASLREFGVDEGAVVVLEEVDGGT